MSRALFLIAGLFVAAMLPRASAGQEPERRSIALGPELRRIRAENPVSHQRFLWTAQQAAKRFLEGKPLADVLRVLRRTGFQLKRYSEPIESEYLQASFPALDYLLPDGGRLAFELSFMVEEEISLTTPTRWLVPYVEVRLRDQVNLPHDRIRHSDRYPPGSLLNAFFNNATVGEAVSYPILESITLGARGPLFILNDTAFDYYQPSNYEISLTLMRKEPERTVKVSTSFTSSIGLEPWRKRSGEPRPGPFVPKDTFGPFFQGRSSSWSASGPIIGILRRGRARRKPGRPPARVYSIADLRALNVGTKEIELRRPLESVDLAELQRFKQLVSLDCSPAYGWPAEPPNGPEWLLALQSLRKFQAIGAEITDRTCSILGRIRSLKEVSIWSSSITDTGVEHLARLPNLERLRLPNHNRLTDRSLRLIGSKPGLREVEIGSGSFTGAGIRTLGQLRRLQTLHLWVPATVASMDLAFLSDLSPIRDLSLSGQSLDDQVLEYLSSLKRLEYLYFDSPAVTDTGIRKLRTLVNARWINLSSCRQLTAAGLKRLHQELSPGFTLR